MINRSPAESAGSDNNVIPCWSCKGPVMNRALFCATCDVMQPPARIDHFSRLGLEISFDVDIDALDRSYFDLQRRLHPDRFVTRSPKERALSQQQATGLNESYEVIKDMSRRAEYLVHLKGIDVMPEGCNQINDPVILMEAMEFREALAEANSLEQVDGIAKSAEADIEDCEAALSLAFRGNDINGACGLATRLKYLNKLMGEVRVQRAKHKN